MGEEKRNRITAAITVNAVILVFILVAIVLYQIVTISILNKRKKQLWEDYYRLVQQLEEAEDFEERIKYDKDLQKIIEELAKLGEKAPKKGAEAAYVFVTI